MNTNLNTDVYNADVYLRLSKEDTLQMGIRRKATALRIKESLS